MTVKVTKDALNLREKLSELDKPSGIAGQDILKADTPQEVFNYIGAGRRNLIINGCFQCWQRNESISSGDTGNTGNGYKYITADHIQTYFPNDYDKNTPVLPTGEKVNALRETQTSGTRAYFTTIIENGGNIFYSGGDVTVSFWARASQAHTLDNGFYFYDSWSSTSYYENASPTRPTVELTTDWKYYSFTFNLPANTSGHKHLAIEWDNTLGTYLNTNEWREFANIQVEVGSVATPFEHRSYGEELALCQRYYQKRSPSSAGGEAFSLTAANTSGANAQPWFFLPVTMRTTPTMTFSYDSLSNISSVGVARIGQEWFHLNISATAASYARIFEPEWTADAEL